MEKFVKGGIKWNTNLPYPIFVWLQNHWHGAIQKMDGDIAIYQNAPQLITVNKNGKI